MCAFKQVIRTQKLIFEPLRWQDEPARMTVIEKGSGVEVYYQITSPRSIDALCCGRLVEELPRILPILGPSHHLAAAMALDRLFKVDPPALARHMRSALLQAQFFTAHLRKITFLLTTWQDPFVDFHAAGRGAHQPEAVPRRLEAIMHHVALAQEAEGILGGRHDHPLTAVAGGISRFLKEPHYERLTQITKALLPFAQELSAFLRPRLANQRGEWSKWLDMPIPNLPSMVLADDDWVEVKTHDGSATEQFPAEQFSDKIGIQGEPWTYRPFAYLKEYGWKGYEQPQGLFCVGPLARFNVGRTAATPLAEEERRRLIECLGVPPQFTLAAAFGAMAVELIQAAEALQALCIKEKLNGPSLRTIPKDMAGSAWAVLEAPQGLIWHHCQVDEKGIVQGAQIFEAATANNALKCQLAKQLVCAAVESKEDSATIRERVAVGLLPF